MQKVNLLRKKVLQLNHDENNIDLSKCTTQENALFCCYYCNLTFFLTHLFFSFFLSSQGNFSTADRDG